MIRISTKPASAFLNRLNLPPQAQIKTASSIQEFAGELANPDTDPEEQVLGLKFLLHFVGDIHQPLHASDNHDRDGNEKKVSATGQPSGNLHHYWDDVFVEQLGPNAKSIASALIGNISEDQVRQWSQGAAADWAMESFKIAKDDAYGQLPEANSKHVYRLSEDYMATATQMSHFSSAKVVYGWRLC